MQKDIPAKRQKPERYDSSAINHMQSLPSGMPYALLHFKFPL